MNYWDDTSGDSEYGTCPECAESKYITCEDVTAEQGREAYLYRCRCGWQSLMVLEDTAIELPRYED